MDLNVHDAKSPAEISLEDKAWIELQITDFEEVLRHSVSKSLEEFADDILYHMSLSLGSLKSVFFVCGEQSDQNSDHIRALAGFACRTEDLGKQHYRIGEGLIGQAVKSNRKMYVENLKTNIDTPIGPITQCSSLLLPLSFNDQVSGVIEFLCKDHLSNLQLLLVEKMAKSTASILINIIARRKAERLLQESLQATEKLQAQEEELRQNMEELQATQEEMRRKDAELSSQISAINNTLATIEFDLDGNILDANNVFLAAMGYNKEEILGKHHRMFMSSTAAKTEAYKKFWADLRKGEAQTGEFMRVARDGSIVWLSASYTPVADSKGRYYKVMKLAINTTEQKNKNLLFETKLKAIDETSSVLEINPKGQITYASNMFLELSGYTQEQLHLQPYEILIFDESREEFLNRKNAISKGVNFSAEMIFRAADGSKIYMHGIITPIRTYEGKLVGITEYWNDQTAQKRLEQDLNEQLAKIAATEEELRQNFEEMLATQETLERKEQEMSGQLKAIDSSGGLAELSASGDIQTFNTHIAKMLGWSMDRSIHVNIKDIWDAGNTKIASEVIHALRHGETFTGEVLLLGNRKCWAWVTLSPVIDATGNVRKLILMVQDITEQKQALHEAERQRKINRATLEGCMDPVVTISERGIIEYVNPAVTKLWGYQSSELIGEKVNKLMPFQHAHQHDSYMNNYLTTGEAKIIGKGRVVPILKKDGSQQEVHLTVTHARIDNQSVFTAFIRELK